MKNCCSAPLGASILSAGTRVKPLNPYSAKRFFDDRDYFVEGSYADTKLYNLAQEAAEDIFTSCCPCVVDEYLCTVEDKAYDHAFDIIADVYKELDRNVPLGIRATASLPSAWSVLCRMVSDELEILYELFEEQSISKEEIDEND